MKVASRSAKKKPRESDPPRPCDGAFPTSYLLSPLLTTSAKLLIFARIISLLSVLWELDSCVRRCHVSSFRILSCFLRPASQNMPPRSRPKCARDPQRTYHIDRESPPSSLSPDATTSRHPLDPPRHRKPLAPTPPTAPLPGQMADAKRTLDLPKSFPQRRCALPTNITSCEDSLDPLVHRECPVRTQRGFFRRSQAHVVCQKLQPSHRLGSDAGRAADLAAL